MDSSAALRCFQCTVSLARILHEKPATAYLPNGNWRTLKILHFSGLVARGKPNSSPKRQNVTLISCVKTPESTVTSNSNGSLEKKTLQTATFPRLERDQRRTSDRILGSGTHFPVRADVAGEVLKLLVDDGDAIGYGDPLVAVLPLFHGIK